MGIRDKLWRLAMALSVPFAFSSVYAEPVINEVLGSTTGTDSEYIELFGEPGTSLEGLSIIIVESDDQASSGTIDRKVDLEAGDIIGDNGFFLLANGIAESTYGVLANRSIADNTIENGSYTIALVETTKIGGGTVSGSEVVIDAVGVTDGDAGDSFFFDAPVIGPDGSFLPAGVGRESDGVDTDTDADWFILNFFNDPSVNMPVAGTFDGGGGGSSPCNGAIVAIGTVQGDGDASLCAGEIATVEGIVTRVAVDLDDTPGAVQRSLDGFFIQDTGDGDPATSDGIFIFLPGLDTASRDNYADVAPGDSVIVTGEVSEFFGSTQIRAQEVELTGTGGTLPAPTPVDLEAVAGELEPFEHTYVDLGELFAANSFGFDRFGEIEAYPFLAFQPTEIAMPGADAITEQSRLEASGIIVDDLRNGAFNEPVPFRVIDNGVDRVIRWGDSLPEGLGIIGFGFGNYRFYPIGNPVVPGDTFAPSNPRPLRAPDVGGELQVASLNTLNFWINDGGQRRGARSPEQFAIQAEKLVEAVLAIDADVLALQELQNDPAGDFLAPERVPEATDFAVDGDGVSLGSESAEVLAELVNRRLGIPGLYKAIDTGVIGTDAIKVGFIYNSHDVKPVGDFTIVDDAIDPDYQDDRNRPSLVQTFEERSTGLEFTAVSVHLKSKGDSGLDEVCITPDLDPNCDQGDGQGFWNTSRAAAARVLAEFLSDPSNLSDPDVIILGDFNAYTMEDPIESVIDRGFTNLDELSSEEPASFVFNGLAGNLDHTFVNEGMRAQVTDAELFDINGTESFETSYFEVLVEPGSIYRSSDHSPLLVGITLDAPVPMSRRDCKRGGWQRVFTDDRKPFGSRGQCLRYVVKQQLQCLRDAWRARFKQNVEGAGDLRACFGYLASYHGKY